MPTYCFRCPKCGNEFEWSMSIKDYSERTINPVCVATDCDGQQEMQSVPVLGGGFSLKGTGWTPKFGGGLGDGPSTDLLIPKKR